MHPGRRDQIRLDAQCIEAVVGREHAGDLSVAGGGGMDLRQPPGDRNGGRRVSLALAQLVFPHRVHRRIEVFHDEQAGRRILPDHPRRRLRADPSGDPEPGEFMMVADDRRLPELRHLELRQGAFQAEPAAGQFDQPDLRGDAAVELAAVHPLM